MNKELSNVFGYNRVFKANGAVIFESGLNIDCDGASQCYAPAGSGLKPLDYLANAGRAGNWWGIATHGGVPYIQKSGDPFPGYYVSTTSLEDDQYEISDPRRYCDSRSVTFVVVPSRPSYASVGDFAMLFNPATGDSSGAIVGDIGPANQIGECSMATARNLSVNPDPKTGGVAHGIITLLFPGTKTTWPLSNKEIAQEADRHFLAWGKLSDLHALFPDHNWH